jgi:hypothetical protein
MEWLCENAKTLDGDRRGRSSKTVLALELASALNLKIELKNVILSAARRENELKLNIWCIIGPAIAAVGDRSSDSLYAPKRRPVV